MESLKETNIIKFHPDTLQVIRKLYGLDQPGAMIDAIDILQEWIKKQNHFLKKDFDRDFLERMIIRAKGSIERSKQRLDKYCTSKTLMSNFFVDCNVREFAYLDVAEDALLPRLTKEYYRVFLMKNIGQEFEREFFTNYFRRLVYILEYSFLKDYAAGYIIVLDYRQTNLVTHLRNMNLVELQHIFTLMMECYGIRIRGIHVISSSKLVNVLVSMFKNILSAKVGSRIHVHSTLETLHEHVEKDILPKEYGGTELSLTELHEQFLDIITSEEHREYMKMMNAAGTNEAFRQTDKYNEQVLGMPGSFRTLKVD